MKKNSQLLINLLLYAVLAIYLFILLQILIFRNVSIWEIINLNRSSFRSVNIIPLRTILSYLSGSSILLRGFAFINVFGNIILFIPLGIYLPLLKQNKRIFENVLWIFLISLLVEIIQYILGVGVGDIDDIILNCAGGFIGLITYKIIEYLFKEEKKVRVFITISVPIVGMSTIFLFTSGLL